jgi:hypothetical protein
MPSKKEMKRKRVPRKKGTKKDKKEIIRAVKFRNVETPRPISMKQSAVKEQDMAISSSKQKQPIIIQNYMYPQEQSQGYIADYFRMNKSQLPISTTAYAKPQMGIPVAGATVISPRQTQAFAYPEKVNMSSSPQASWPYQFSLQKPSEDIPEKSREELITESMLGSATNFSPSYNPQFPSMSQSSTMEGREGMSRRIITEVQEGEDGPYITFKSKPKKEEMKGEGEEEFEAVTLPSLRQRAKERAKDIKESSSKLKESSSKLKEIIPKSPSWK